MYNNSNMINFSQVNKPSMVSDDSRSLSTFYSDYNTRSNINTMQFSQCSQGLNEQDLNDLTDCIVSNIYEDIKLKMIEMNSNTDVDVKEIRARVNNKILLMNERRLNERKHSQEQVKRLIDGLCLSFKDQLENLKAQMHNLRSKDYEELKNKLFKINSRLIHIKYFLSSDMGNELNKFSNDLNQAEDTLDKDTQEILELIQGRSNKSNLSTQTTNKKDLEELEKLLYRYNETLSYFKHFQTNTEKLEIQSSYFNYIAERSVRKISDKIEKTKARNNKESIECFNIRTVKTRVDKGIFLRYSRK